MNYTEANSVMTSYFTGSRRLNNIFWAIIVSLGGFGALATPMSVLPTDSRAIPWLIVILEIPAHAIYIDSSIL